jgi:hypothetical protein
LGVAEAFGLAHPVLDVCEAAWVGEIEDEHDALGSFVVGTDDGLELFLAGGVPHLKLDHAASLLDGSDFEVDADGRQEGLMEDIVGEAE